MIDTDQKLGAFMTHLRRAEWLAVDTEADSLHAYPEKLCLIQVSLEGQDVLIDPLSGIDLDPLWQVLRERELILHGADYDLRLLHRNAGVAPRAVFDTMFAARLVGQTAFGLTDLVYHYLDVTLEKGPQKADWAQRPLTERMATYAANDTRYLKPLADILRRDLVSLGRLSWHQQMCAQLVTECRQPRDEDPDTVWRLGGCDRLDRRSMAVVRELWHWREREAVAANKPPFFVLSHDTLVALAVAAVAGRSVDSLIPRRYSQHRREGLLKSLVRALALPDSHLPHPRRQRGHRLTPQAKRRIEDLRQIRDRHAAELQIDPALIASRAQLTLFASDEGKHQDELLPWQRELLLEHPP